MAQIGSQMLKLEAQLRRTNKTHVFSCLVARLTRCKPHQIPNANPAPTMDRHLFACPILANCNCGQWRAPLSLICGRSFLSPLAVRAKQNGCHRLRVSLGQTVGECWALSLVVHQPTTSATWDLQPNTKRADLSCLLFRDCVLTRTQKRHDVI